APPGLTPHPGPLPFEGRGRNLAAVAVNEAQATLIEALVSDLQSNRGASIIIAGEEQSPVVHALAHLMNHALGNVGQTIFYTDSAQANPVNQLESLRALVEEMKAGTVETLFILGGNPAYTAPADLGFLQALANVKRSIHLGLELDETASHCQWHIPQAHYLES